MSISIIDTIFCPFTNYLKLLPHILKMNVWFNWIITFCLPNVILNVWFGVCFDDPSIFIKDIERFYGVTLLYLIPQIPLIILSFLYLKHIVLKTNPIYHLIHLHPEGQKVLNEGWGCAYSRNGERSIVYSHFCTRITLKKMNKMILKSLFLSSYSSSSVQSRFNLWRDNPWWPLSGLTHFGNAIRPWTRSIQMVAPTVCAYLKGLKINLKIFSIQFIKIIFIFVFISW